MNRTNDSVTADDEVITKMVLTGHVQYSYNTVTTNERSTMLLSVFVLF